MRHKNILTTFMFLVVAYTTFVAVSNLTSVTVTKRSMSTVGGGDDTGTPPNTFTKNIPANNQNVVPPAATEMSFQLKDILPVKTDRKDIPADSHSAHKSDTDKHKQRTPHCSYDERKGNLQAVCEKYKLGKKLKFQANKPGEYSHVMVDDRHRVLYCYVPKAGCSSWKHLIALQSGKTSFAALQKDWNVVHEGNASKYGLVKLSSNNISEIHRKLNAYTKFLVVRNPFARLHSAYVDKFVWFYHRYAKVYYKKIIEKTYPKSPVIGGNRFITFEQLARIIVEAHTKPSKFLHLPTIDEHWRTINGMCHPCFIDYDYIAKIETMDEDSPPLLKLFNATELPSVHVMEEDEARRKNAFNYSRPSTQEAYANMSQVVVDGLRNIFQIDMDLFGYSQSREGGLQCKYDNSSTTCC